MTDPGALRADLPSVREAAYLNTGTFGPLPEPARRAMRDYLDQATDRGRIGAGAFETWMQLMGGARSAFARAFGVGEELVALTHSTTDGVNLVLWGLDWRPGDVVVTSTSEHPGLTEPLLTLHERRGVEVREVALEGRDDPAAALVAAIDERTRLVAVSHVLWTDGLVLDVAPVAAAAHAAGGLVLLDGAQGAGCVSIDLDALGCDFYALSGQKWLCGPSGTGALLVPPDRLEALAPAWPNYITRDRHGGPEPVLWPAARRFDVGTITLDALAGIAAAIEWRVQHGIEGGIARAGVLAQQLRAALADVPRVEPVEVVAASSLVSFAVERDPAELATALDARGVLVRSVPGRPWVRASVGPWNHEGDLDRLVEALRAEA